MKKVFLGFALVLVGGFALTGCLKSKDSGCPYTEVKVTKVDTQAAKVKDYLDNKGITDYVADASGLYYSIQAPGTGTITATPCSLITAKYKGMLTDGTVFENPAEPIMFYLGGVISGWQIGLTKIKSGGKITLYIPPYMAYGSTERRDPVTNEVKIPANSILIFEVELQSVAQ